MLRQTKTSHTDHLLLETLIESLNELGTIKKEALTQNWRDRVDSETVKETAETQREKVLQEILAENVPANLDLFTHLIKEGIKLLNVNEEKQGFRMLEKALLISPKNLALLLFVAENYFKIDKFELAKSYLEKAQKLSPKNPKVQLLLGVIYADEGETENAEKLLKSLAQKKEKSVCANYILGMIAARNQEWNSALNAFKSVLSVTESAEINYLVGCVYFQQQRFKIALRFFQKALEMSANFADAWFMMSAIYQHLNEQKKSEEARQMALISKETGAQSLEFLKQRSPENLTIALPFIRLQHSKQRLLTGGSKRLTNFFREKLSKCLK